MLTTVDSSRLAPSVTEISQKFIKKILHLWKIPVISQMRTNFAEMPGKSLSSGSREMESRSRDQGRRGGESESLEEEDIEIGNS